MLWGIGLAVFVGIGLPLAALLSIPFFLEVLSLSAVQNFRLSIVIDDDGREVVGSAVFLSVQSY